MKINVLLVCYAGMSTSILMRSMKIEASKRNIELVIEAVPFSEFIHYLDGVDVILLGPQIRHAKSEITKVTKIPIGNISVIDYGRVQGDNVLNNALEIFRKYNKTYSEL